MYLYFFIFRFILKKINIDKKNGIEFCYTKQYREVKILLKLKKSNEIEANSVVRLDSYFMVNGDLDNFYLAIEFCDVYNLSLFLNLIIVILTCH